MVSLRWFSQLHVSACVGGRPAEEINGVMPRATTGFMRIGAAPVFVAAPALKLVAGLPEVRPPAGVPVAPVSRVSRSCRYFS